MKFLLKIIETEIHKEAMRIGFLFLFLSWFDTHAREDWPLKFEDIGLIMIGVGTIFLIIDFINSRKKI